MLHGEPSRFTFASRQLKADAIIDALRCFAQHSCDWKILAEATLEYTAAIGVPALVIEYTAQSEVDGAAVALAESFDHPGVVKIYKIVPRSGELDEASYDAIAIQLVQVYEGSLETSRSRSDAAFRKFARRAI